MESEYAEENVSTEQSPTRQKARISRPDGDEKRPRGDKTPSRERPQAPDGPALLDFRLPKEARLAKRAEFLRVYEQGRRIEGKYMTVFILANDLGRHRLGVTSTKKAIGKAHDRNRAKRLMREAFRLSKADLAGIETSYDWVLNARRRILKVKLDEPLAEFKTLARKLATEYTESAEGFLEKAD